jgi:hypothetical protein
MSIHDAQPARQAATQMTGAYCRDGQIQGQRSARELRDGAAGRRGRTLNVAALTGQPKGEMRTANRRRLKPAATA